MVVYMAKASHISKEVIMTIL